MKPEICRFLVDEGAGVDFIETGDELDDGLLVLESTRNSMNALLMSLAYPGLS